MTEMARVFVPGHVTGFFTVDRRSEPTRTGSRGAGIALSEGVTITVRPAEESAVFLDGERTLMDAVHRVLDALDVQAHVRAVTDLPLGAGFGVSGATALGAALAVNRVFDRRLSVRELTTIAHGAEVQAGTGLGDVVAQARGGVPIRLEPGGPQHNVLDGVSAAGRVEYLTLGERSTAEVIEGDTETLTTAGERALSSLVAEPTVEQFMRASRQFSREASLLTEGVRATIMDVTDAGGDAAMAMLGETVFALGSGLTDAGYDATVTTVDSAGARLVA